MPRYLVKNRTVLVRSGWVYAFLVFVLGRVWREVACGVVLIVALNHLNRRVYRQCADPLLAASEQGYGNQPVWTWLFCVNVAARAVNFGGSSRRDYLTLLEHAARAGKKSQEIPASLQDSILLQDGPAVIARQARL
ncbi:hypothetical protein JBE38_16860 [Pseudomonas sp. ICBG1301]|uniref:hypothetical protein n=1 Tax=Pseudomonas sp. ICBG1301 TaxID=2795987 RepID=UPI001962616A|nr:hypothetical protein [Pseudomonas sp. ICBG1301]MBM9487604.1 hypothetical protein [Pseudomonas sp. ICBG1301]